MWSIQEVNAALFHYHLFQNADKIKTQSQGKIYIVSRIYFFGIISSNKTSGKLIFHNLQKRVDLNKIANDLYFSP